MNQPYKFFLLCFGLLLAGFSVQAQGLNWAESVIPASASAGILARANTIAIDADGNVYAAGWTGGGTFIGPFSYFSNHYNSNVGSSRVDLQACKLEYSIVSPK